MSRHQDGHYLPKCTTCLDERANLRNLGLETENPSPRLQDYNNSHSAMISDMEPASFTIEFPVHVPAVKRRDWLDRLGTFGASVEQLAPEVFKVVCADAHVVDKIGWALLRTSLSKYCRVVSTSGGVEARASAYQIRSRKQDRRPRPY